METFDALMKRLGAKPVPKEQVARFERAMEKVVAKSVEYQREQARLAQETRRRIVW